MLKFLRLWFNVQKVVIVHSLKFFLKKKSGLKNYYIFAFERPILYYYNETIFLCECDFVRVHTRL